MDPQVEKISQNITLICIFSLVRKCLHWSEFFGKMKAMPAYLNMLPCF